MASKRHQRRRSCESKRRYATKADAEAGRQGMRGLHVYSCHFCGHYHLGHGPHLERADMKQRRQQGTI